MKLGSRDIQMRKIMAIAALGVVGFGGVAACGAATPAIRQPRPPTLLPSASAARAGHDGVAQDIARIAVGNGGLAALDNGDGRATLAICDPGTVPNLHIGTPMSASCGISYSDGSVWRQTVTVTFDSHGHPVADWTDTGTELFQPIGG